MKRLILMALAAGLLSGCASIYTVKKHNESTREKVALRVRAMGEQGAAVEADLMELGTGYFSAWSDTPGAMATATAIDAAGAVLMGLGVSKVYEATQEDDDQEPGPYPESTEPVPTIQASGTTTIVIVGDGNTVTAEGAGEGPE